RRKSSQIVALQLYCDPKHNRIWPRIASGRAQPTRAPTVQLPPQETLRYPYRLLQANLESSRFRSSPTRQPGYGKTLMSTTDGEGSKGCTLSTPKEIPWLSTNLPTSLIAIWAHANPVLLTCWMRLAIRALMSLQPLRCQKTLPSKT